MNEVIQISDVQEMLEQLSELKSIMENQEFDKYNLSDEDMMGPSGGSSTGFKMMSIFVIITVRILLFYKLSFVN